MDVVKSVEPIEEHQKRDFTDWVSAKVDYYLNHQQDLYRPYLNAYLLICLLALGRNLKSISLFLEDFYGLDTFYYFEPFVALGTALVTYSLLNRRRSEGVSLFAILLILMMAEGSVFFAFAGIYVIANEAFRRARAGALPRWYRRIASEG